MLDKMKISALSRRAFVGKVAAGVAGATVVLAAGGRGAEALSHPGQPTTRLGEDDNGVGSALAPIEPQVATAEALEPSGPPPWNLLHPLAEGSLVAHGWRVADLSGVEGGSFVLTLQNERGRAHRVHLCRNDGSPQGLVYTKQLDLVVMNGGQGDLPTEEGLAQAVAEVAHVLAANEADRQHESLVTALLPQAERAQRFGATTRLR